MKKILLIAGAVVIVVLIVVGNVRRGSEKAVKVQVGKVTMGDITSMVRAPGKIRPEKEVQISSSVPGQIVQLAVREGDRVQQGQLLLQLDKTEYLAQVKQRRAMLESARASLRLAEAAFDQDDSIYQRKKALYDKKLASSEELEAARTRMTLSKAEVDAARQRVDEYLAVLNIAEDDLAKTTFLAPQSGVVSELNVEEGENVVLGTMNVPGTVIMTVADLAHMQVECDVDETDIVKIRKGQKARVFVDAFPDTVFEASVVEMGSSGRSSSVGGEVAATDFKVKLALKPGIDNLKPGMTADGEIETATHRNILTVPIQAVAVRDKKTVDKWMKKREEEAEKAKPAKKKQAKDKKDSEQKPADEEKPGADETAGLQEVEEQQAATPPSDTASAETVGDSAAAQDSVDSEAVRPRGKAEDEEVTGVFVVEDEKARFVPVTTGIMSETDVEILSGVSESDVVVTGPFRVLRDLRDGQPVKEEKKGKKGEEEEGED